MREALRDAPAWYVAGPLMGLVVVGLVVTLGERIGVMGGFSGLVERAVLGRRVGWTVWFVVGVVLGGTLFSLSGAAWRVHEEYAWLEDTVGRAALAPLLVGGGVLIGYGSRLAGGCTSGNGIGGCSFASPASFVATATFMATAVAGAFTWQWLL